MVATAGLTRSTTNFRFVSIRVGEPRGVDAVAAVDVGLNPAKNLANVVGGVAQA